MGYAEDKVVYTAIEELGYMEKKSNKDLDQKVGSNVGANNFTKYARDVKHANGLAWCQTFIAAVLVYAFGSEVANKLLCGKLSSASTMEVKDAFKKARRLVDVKDAKAGDIMYRSRNGGGHVGWCIGRTADGGVITIEGNSSADDPTAWNGGEVCKHKNGHWEWCARPDYSIVKEPKNYVIGWHDDNGRWWYADTKEHYLSNCWHKIENYWYYFDKDGYMVTGLQRIYGSLYYFNEEKGSTEGIMMRTNTAGAFMIKKE